MAYDAYKALAERNGWEFSMIDNRPYFKKDGNYAVPDENTSREDKELLASIISEGSENLRNIILTCWENGITITGPCSGIREEHDEPPYSLHFGITSSKELASLVNQRLSEQLPNCNHLLRENPDNSYRYDLGLPLRSAGIELSKDQSEQIFKVIFDQLNNVLEENKEKNK